jgi:hypothetical protein
VKIYRSWSVLLLLNVLAWGVLGIFQFTSAQQSTGGQLPFANSIEQRGDILRELREIKDLIKEQNALLREGGVKDARPAQPVETRR